MSDQIEKLSSKLGNGVVAVGKCPNCGEPTYIPKHFFMTGKKFEPVCAHCGNKENDIYRSSRISEKEKNMLVDTGIARMKNSSIITDNKAWNYRFSNYNVYDAETGRAKEMALMWAIEFIEGSNLHAILTGSTGVGKTHLGFSIAWEVLEKSNYQKHVSIISYRELLEQLKFAFNDKEAHKKIQGSIIKDIKKADLVIIDDLGAELGRIEEPSKPTNYNLDTLTSLVESRLNKATVFTSNLDSDQILNLYGQRIYSRIVNGMTIDNQYHAFRFKTASDKRREKKGV